MTHLQFWIGLCAVPALAASCESLKDLNLPHTSITVAENVAAGAFVPPPSPDRGSGQIADAFRKAPAFCRVAADLHPTSDSDIKVEIWIPASGWNGKYQGQGNGGFAGSIGYDAMAATIAQGYATAGTDTGHAASGVDARWALHHPEKVNDFGWRAIHEMTVTAKAVIAAYAGSAARRSYFDSCSDGGREALMEAQRFPADYDGIIAGAPANYWTHLLSKAAADLQALQANPASYIPPAKLPAIAHAVLAACDAQDGLADGIINDPPRCHFDPATILCKGADSDTCLTAPQVTALKELYAGPRDAHGKLVFPGYEPGAEEGFGGWALWITGSHPDSSLMYMFSTEYFANMVYEDSAWSWRTFDINSSTAAADEKTSGALNATNPDLSAFERRGGKLILWHGWDDPAISAQNTVNYYNSVIAALGKAKADSFVRLYMAPGVQHCGGGPGPDSFHQFGPVLAPADARHDMSVALEQWVDKGIAPDSIIATKMSKAGVEMTRPLCPYPQVAHYKGKGDPKDAASFVCAIR